MDYVNDKYELSKDDTQMLKGIAIIGMVMLHLFCRIENLPYDVFLYAGNTPLIYYFGLFGDICVPIYCFCSGYAHYLLSERTTREKYVKRIPEKVFRFVLNYWVVLFMFSTISLLCGSKEIIPVSPKTFLGNMFLYRLSYNGAWWFIVTYLFLLVLSPVLFVVTKKVNSVILVLVSGVIYVVAYVFRFEIIFNIDNVVVSWIWQQAVLLGTSQFAYIIGMVFRKNRIVSKLRGKLIYEQGYKELSMSRRFSKICIIYLLPCIGFLGHCVVQNIIVAPVTALAVILSYSMLKKPRIIRLILFFMGEHSTNIWFVHMFYYLVLFEGFVFKFQYTPLIILVMFALCIATSYAINGIYQPICNLIFNRRCLNQVRNKR